MEQQLMEQQLMAQNIRLLMDQSTAPVMGHLTAKKIVQGR
jgi:hypothetical protein